MIGKITIDKSISKQTRNITLMIKHKCRKYVTENLPNMNI